MITSNLDSDRYIKTTFIHNTCSEEKLNSIEVFYKNYFLTVLHRKQFINDADFYTGFSLWLDSDGVGRIKNQIKYWDKLSKDVQRLILSRVRYRLATSGSDNKFESRNEMLLFCIQMQDIVLSIDSLIPVS